MAGKQRGISVVYYESIKREPKRRLIYEYRCDERLKTKTEESTRLANTGLVVVEVIFIYLFEVTIRFYTITTLFFRISLTDKVNFASLLSRTLVDVTKMHVSECDKNSVFYFLIDVGKSQTVFSRRLFMLDVHSKKIS
jgi:hypothetical protein